jgi:hypothetical protein
VPRIALDNVPAETQMIAGLTATAAILPQNLRNGS